MGLIDETSKQYYEGPDNSFNTGDESYGNYQFTSLEDIITNFTVAYVGEDKIIPKISRSDIQFFASRILQEFSFDTFKSTKSLELKVPNTLVVPLPQDYVSYVKMAWVDNSGVEHVVYPMSKTSNPTSLNQDGTTYQYNTDGSLKLNTDSESWSRYKTHNPSENDNHDYDYDDEIYESNQGGRYGIDPAFAQTNGGFYIDDLKGRIHFSSNISGEFVVIKYISDSLGTDAEMQVHKLAEEAMYKNIAYSIVSTRANMPINLVMRLKKEAFASKRTAKLRLSNIKVEELTQILRGKSKQIKH